MSITKRKVSFFLLTLEKHTLISERNTTEFKYLTNTEIENNFQGIYNNKMRELSNKNKAVVINTPANDYVVEIIDYSSHKVFLKIGQQNPPHTIELRHGTTLETEKVPMRDGQLLELYTFCFIDFETGIVSYIGINGAPKISAIKYLFDNFLSKDLKIYANLSAIMTNDILETLTKKSIISKITLSVSVPSDEILSGPIGLGANDFDDFRNIKTSTVTYNIVATKNKNIFGSSSSLGTLIGTIRTKYGDNIKHLSANAKNLDESSQTYNLLQYNFTKTVLLGVDDNSLLNEADFKEALENTYNTYRDELLTYCHS